MLNSPLRTAALSLLAGASFIPFEQAFAQSASQPPAASSPGAQLTEVVVTAERRTENSQKVPVSIEHIDARKIENAAYTQVTDLQYLAPGLQYDPTNGAAFQVRGVGSTSFDFSNAKSVSVVVDDVVMDAQRANGLIGLADIANVDILMGPQGTLFGMNSTSGVIAVTTNKPQLGVYSVRASASYGERNDRILNGTVNLSVGRDAALRLSVFDNAQDGYGRNPTLGKTVGSFDEYGFRGKIFYQPSNVFDVTLQGDYAHHYDTSVRTPTGGQPTVVQTYLNSAGIHPSTTSADTADSSLGYIETGEWGASMKAHLKIGDNDLTSITAYRGSLYNNSTPIDFVPTQIYAYVPFNLGQLGTKKFSEEVHFASPTGHLFEYLVGAFYNRLDARQTQYQWGTLGAPTVTAAGAPVPGLYALTGAIGQAGNTQLFNAVNESAAAFGQVRLNFTPQFTIAVGGRYTADWNSQGLSFITTNPVPITGYSPTFTATSAAPVVSSGERTGSNFSFRVSPEYHFTRNVMAYATYSTGYKPGGVAFVSNRYDPFEQETVTSYEVGIKSEWLNHRLRVNADVFREDFKDFQASLLTTVPGSALPVIAIGNAGGLRSQGAEGTVEVKPIRDLTLSGSVTYTDAVFTNYRYNATTDYTGSQLTNSPKWAANLSADYEYGLMNDWRVRAHADYNYRSSYYTVIGEPAYAVIPAYGLVNGRVALSPEGSHVEFGVYARNLFDQFFSTGWVYSSAIGYLHYTTPDAHRTVGGFINVKF